MPVSLYGNSPFSSKPPLPSFLPVSRGNLMIGSEKEGTKYFYSGKKLSGFRLPEKENPGNCGH
jgi:hypothetical protein